ncbi:hypothetical protein BJV77DRAFT_1154902 [Russula vinacea]|nr:hypothetical protein BJV77DRAFT_1154902 [Russula vinacea]
MVDITAQFNWWRRWQPQAGWWGAEGSHTYGPLVLVGLVYGGTKKEEPASWATRVTSDPTDQLTRLSNRFLVANVAVEGGEKHRAFIKGKTNKQKSEYDGKFFILSLQKIKTNFLQHWELDSRAASLDACEHIGADGGIVHVCAIGDASKPRDDMKNTECLSANRRGDEVATSSPQMMPNWTVLHSRRAYGQNWVRVESWADQGVGRFCIMGLQYSTVQSQGELSREAWSAKKSGWIANDHRNVEFP